ncbi:hypothetical protein L873DRAFT_525878 [Choiromyces venosus 120613-1]|uniref:Uncharacterized protein n=1 Tax=Choiromyces venosus 120613-1 TaxID=1336337 RepID=A0A3N4K861_9PEZI|nr:hypothetical protein L873DRAFT_525878 [Choiromyces venosus 120613-1]
MVSRVDPDRWLSTAEFFRASLPDDEVGARGGPDEQARYYAEAHPPVYGATAPAWLERRPIDRKGYQEQKQSADQPTINNWAREETQPANSLQIVIGRQPLPPSVDAAAVCKTSSKPIEHRPWATYCEIRALDAIHQYYIDHPNEFRHIPVPRVYTTSHQHGESALPFHREELSYIIMEHIKDNSSLHSSFRSGDQGWTRRQKRRFVRKMALMRLQLLFIRNNPSRIEPPMQYRVRMFYIRH